MTANATARATPRGNQGRLCVLNAGSSSLKFAVYGIEGGLRQLQTGAVEGIGGSGKVRLRIATADGKPVHEATLDAPDHAAALDAVEAVHDGPLTRAGLAGFGHRVVHGGPDMTAPVVVDAATLARIEALNPLAPLHNPPAVAVLRALVPASPSLWTSGSPGWRRSPPLAPRRRERRYKVTFPAPPHTGRVVIEAEGLAKAYGGPPVFEEVTFAVERGQRLLVMGLNGAGKTSLLRILAGLAEPTDGSWRSGIGVSIGYYAQEHEGIVAGRSVIDHVREQSDAPETELRGLLGMFGLIGDKAFQDASTLSGGEKTKLALAQLVAGRHNCLLLDEPTNNLDPPSREGIGRALSEWPGAMVLVSHDAGFVSELAPDRVLLMPDGTEDSWSDELLDLVTMA